MTGDEGSTRMNGDGGHVSIDVIDPTREETIGSVPSSTGDEVVAALRAAHDAQHDWAQTPIVRRGDYLRAIADVFAANANMLANSLVKEVGKPLAQAKAEVQFALGFLRYNADWDRRLEGEILPGDVPGETIHLLRAPLGVVSAICPWNFPLAVFCRKVAPALLTGNTVVAKPSEVTPLTTIVAMDLINDRIGLPPGVLTLVTGAGDVGAALVESDLTALVSFTGHRDTGKAVLTAAARNLTRVSLELGGKAPAIVWKDADLDVAVPAIVAARHTNAGQVCTAAERVFVHDDLYEPFLDAYVAAVQDLTIGLPSGEVDLGPLASAQQLAKTDLAVRTAVGEGAELIAGGSAPSDEALARGYWY